MGNADELGRVTTAMFTAVLMCMSHAGQAQTSPLPPLPNHQAGWLYFYQSDYQRGQIYRMRPDGSVRQQLTHAAREAVDPAMSPDGTTVVYAHNNEGVAELNLMKLDGTSERIIPVEPPVEKGSQISYRIPQFTADGRHIIFVLQYMHREDDSEGSWFFPDPKRGNTIYQVDPDGRHLQEITRENGHVTSLALSADSTRLLWTALSSKAKNSAQCMLRTLSLRRHQLTSRPLATGGRVISTTKGPWLVEYVKYSSLNERSGAKLTDLQNGRYYYVQASAFTDDYAVCVSANLDRIAYVVRDGANSDLYVAHLNKLEDSCEIRTFESANGYIFALNGLLWCPN